MTDSFDDVFGARNAPRPTFTERINPMQAPPRESALSSSVYKPYDALVAGHLVEGCEVARWIDGTEIPEGIEFQYRFLMQVGFVGEEQLKLFLPDCIVVIEGRHLRDLRKMLTRRAVTFIQEYNPRIWPAPSKAAPIIERIAVMRPEAVARA